MAFNHTILEQQDSLKGSSNLLRASHEDLIKSRSEIEKLNQELDTLKKARIAVDNDLQRKTARLKTLNGKIAYEEKKYIIDQGSKAFQVINTIDTSSSLLGSVCVSSSLPPCYAGAISSFTTQTNIIQQEPLVLSQQKSITDDDVVVNSVWDVLKESPPGLMAYDDGGLGYFVDGDNLLSEQGLFPHYNP
jgi:hypothetical protein